MSDEIQTATGRSAIDRARGIAFSKALPKSSLEYSRKNLQEEISKLTMIVSDETITLTDEEIMDINEQINTLLQDKHRVELDLRHESGINLVHAISKKTIYFGRAKKIQERLEISQIDTSQKRKVFETTNVVIPQEDIVKQIINKSSVAPKKKLKQIDFD